jgi:tRNA pseudouridine55 synthase
VSRESILNALPSFLGEQNQVAPLFSAKSVDGVRVYELARKRYKAGLPVDEPGILQASRINIYGMELLRFSDCSDAAAKASGPGGMPPSALLEGGAQPQVGRDDGEAGTGADLMAFRRTPNNRINVAEVPPGLPQAEILVDCSKGTYIRALARDLGESLGTGAFLHSLRRTKNGGFSIEEALAIEDIRSILEQE